MEWADATVWQGVLKHFSENNNSGLSKLLFHIHTVQRAFYYVWTKQSLNFPKETDFPDMQGIAKWGKEFHTLVKEFLNKSNQNDLNKIIEIPWAIKLEKIIGRKPESTTFEETMLQVAMHSAYHRGQVSVRLRELGGQPQPNDFIYWVWLGKPGAVWDLLNT